MTIRVAPLTGKLLAQGLPAVARLRIAVFRDWPYLYDGSLASGEMRNSTDWNAQPGAAPLAQNVEIVALT